jgi:transaldolase
MSRLRNLSELGCAVWLDFVDRRLVTTGQLQRLVEEDALSGVTSNPSIFEKSLSQGEDYAALLERFDAANPHASRLDRYEHLAVTDIQAAADILRPVYDRTAAADGYVSLEVSPHLADDPSGTLAEARRLWARVDRPNLMIKIPGTSACVPAIRDAIAEGMNVNVTLLFSLTAYRDVAMAFVDGLERRLAQGLAIEQISSVASFFISRIDAEVDGRLAAIGSPDALALQGKVAIANARRAYQWFVDFRQSERWSAVAREGAQIQRLLWASTATKNPAYPDTLYVSELIAPYTVNTMPPATLAAFRDHGLVTPATASTGIDEARATMVALERMGIELEAVTAELTLAGVQTFSTAFDNLLRSLPPPKTR